MCLAVPGQITSVYGNDPLTRSGKVNFGGIVKEVCLAYTPEATIGDYVLVHVGFALQVVDEDEAREVFSFLDRMGELSELNETEPTTVVAEEPAA